MGMYFCFLSQFHSCTKGRQSESQGMAPRAYSERAASILTLRERERQEERYWGGQHQQDETGGQVSPVALEHHLGHCGLVPITRCLPTISTHFQSPNFTVCLQWH